MGSTKNYWHDQINARMDPKLSDILGVSVEELGQLTYDIDPHTSRSGDLYGYNVTFYGDNDPDIMKKIQGLEEGYYVSLDPWDLYPDPDEEWSDEIELNWQVQHPDPLEVFNKQMKAVSDLLSSPVDESVQFNFLVMLHAHTISSFEYFLASSYIHHVTNSDILTRRLIKSNPEFQQRNFKLNEIYDQYDKIKTTVAEYLNNIIFHNINTIKPMFSDVLLFKFEKHDLKWLGKAVAMRHDCAHRAGYNKDGVAIDLTESGIRELLGKCKQLAENIDSHIRTISEHNFELPKEDVDEIA